MLKYLSAAVLGLAACASGADALMGVDSNVTATTIASSSSVASTSFDLNEANKNAWLSAAGIHIHIPLLLISHAGAYVTRTYLTPYS